MNRMDELIALIREKSRITYQKRACFLQEEEYTKVLRGVFQIYNSGEDYSPNTHRISKKTNLVFGELLYPFLCYATNMIPVKSHIIHISKGAIEDLECLLLEKLSKLSSQAFFFEFSKINASTSRTSGSISLDDTEALSGDIADKNKYNEFVANFLKMNWKTFFLEYSVLAMLMAAQTLQWINMVKKFLRALIKDSSEIKNTFFLDDEKGNIMSIKAADHIGLNPEELHLLLDFEKDYKLIYKARSIDTEISFYSFLNWIESKCGGLRLKRLQMIAGNNYGWMEYVPQTACLSEAEVKNFYSRAGMLLALLYAFGSSDMHCLNLIAHGEHPVMVDMEALTGRRIDTDVRNTFFIPSDLIINDGRPVYSNALGAETFTRSFHKELQWLNVNTDQMKPIHRYRAVSPTSVVFQKDKKIYSYHYYEQLLEGFELVYQYIRDHKWAVIEAIYEHFNRCSVRYYPRVYRSYIKAVYNSIAPRYLKSGEDRLLVLLKELDGSTMIDRYMPEKCKLYELEHLFLNSIPRFHVTYPDGIIKELAASNSSDFHLDAPINIVQARINRFSEQDLKHQKMLIRKTYQDYKANLIKYEMES